MTRLYWDLHVMSQWRCSLKNSKIPVKTDEITHVVNVPDPLVGSVPPCAVFRYCDELKPWFLTRYCWARVHFQITHHSSSSPRTTTHLKENVYVPTKVRDRPTRRKEWIYEVRTIWPSVQVPKTVSNSYVLTFPIAWLEILPGTPG